MLGGLYSFFKKIMIPLQFRWNSKGNNIFNIFYRLFFAFRISLFRIFFKKWHVVWIGYCFATVIFVPNLAEGCTFFICEEKSEFIDCRLMFDKDGFKEIGSIKSRISGILERCEFNRKGFSKTHTSKMPCIEKRTDNGKAMIKPSPSHSPSNTETARDKCYFIGSKFQIYFYAFLGGIIGIGIGMLLIIFIHTQRAGKRLDRLTCWLGSVSLSNAKECPYFFS